ncbi:MAG TPA: type I restriction enzyme HsdR N-terminal domain-containing protein [Bacteroidales bacterium]|nr:type I restriction enzyme HsdR N-terminal domain-containing protein [Bacteroidales bacterium]
MMKPLNLPQYSHKIKRDQDGEKIFDPFRSRYVALTPEEWVRQHFLNYMVTALGYSPGLIKVEASFRLNSMLRRADILVYSREGNPVLIVECKAPEVKLSQTVFDQIINYNFNYCVRYLIVTNGITHYAAEVDREKKNISFLKKMPEFKDII